MDFQVSTVLTQDYFYSRRHLHAPASTHSILPNPPPTQPKNFSSQSANDDSALHAHAVDSPVPMGCRSPQQLCKYPAAQAPALRQDPSDRFSHVNVNVKSMPRPWRPSHETTPRLTLAPFSLACQQIGHMEADQYPRPTGDRMRKPRRGVPSCHRS